MNFIETMLTHEKIQDLHAASEQQIISEAISHFEWSEGLLFELWEFIAERVIRKDGSFCHLDALEQMIINRTPPAWRDEWLNEMDMKRKAHFEQYISPLH